MPLVPAYIGYRAVRAYLTLEMLFSLPLKAQGVPSMFTKFAEFPPAQSARASTARTLSAPAVAASYNHLSDIANPAILLVRRAARPALWLQMGNVLKLIVILVLLAAPAVSSRCNDI